MFFWPTEDAVGSGLIAPVSGPRVSVPVRTMQDFADQKRLAKSAQRRLEQHASAEKL